MDQDLTVAIVQVATEDNKDFTSVLRFSNFMLAVLKEFGMRRFLGNGEKQNIIAKFLQ